MNFLKPAKYFFALSAVLTVISVVLVIFPGPRLSIEFTGGTRMELNVVNAEKTAADVSSAFVGFREGELKPTINRMQNGHFLIRMKGIDDATHRELIEHLTAALGEINEVQYTTIGPTVGATLKWRAGQAILAACIGIILYLAFAFRKIPRKYNPWKFGIVAVVTLTHDIMVTVGIFVILGYFTSFEVDTLFITALLTILGYSVNDTIIVFDRIRDNLFLQERRDSFAEVANTSINQVWKRSCYTTGSTLIMLVSLFLLGSVSIQWFVLTLIIGITIGTYSSIFVATPLLVYWNKGNRT